MSAYTYSAVCPNGEESRQDFCDIEEAELWIEWGHCCVAAKYHAIHRHHPLDATPNVLRPAVPYNAGVGI
jgi:hypothetical protein